jgi:hypothetical protein
MAKLFHLFGPIKWYRQRPIWPGNHLTVCPKTHASPKPILPLTQSNSAILTYFDLFHMYLYCICTVFDLLFREFGILGSLCRPELGKTLFCVEASWSPETFVTGVVVTGNRSNWTTVGSTCGNDAAQCDWSCVDWPELPELPEHGDEKMRRFEFWDSHG